MFFFFFTYTQQHYYGLRIVKIVDYFRPNTTFFSHCKVYYLPTYCILVGRCRNNILGRVDEKYCFDTCHYGGALGQFFLLFSGQKCTSQNKHYDHSNYRKWLMRFTWITHLFYYSDYSQLSENIINYNCCNNTLARVKLIIYSDKIKKYDVFISTLIIVIHRCDCCFSATRFMKLRY